MGVSIDTIFTKVANPSTTFTATTANGGDSLVVRSFAATDSCIITNLIRGGATKGAARVRSPLLYDNIEGYQVYSAENPSELAIPVNLGQAVRPTDTLIVEVTGGAAETDAAALTLLYSNLPGSTPRLKQWGDISGLISNIKGLHVLVANSGTVGNWTDTVLTTTENILKANTDHAILGYLTDTACTVVAVKGQETNSLRVGGPGSLKSLLTGNYFVDQSNALGMPMIPVFNANNANNTYVSTADVVASSAPNITLVLAELSQNIS